RYTAGFDYQVVVRGLDAATNISTGTPPGTEGRTFLYDDQAPVVVSTFPGSGQAYNAATLTPLAGTAADSATGNSGVNVVQILLKNGILGNYWSGVGNGFDAPPPGYGNWVTVTGTGTWSRAWPTLNDNALYYLWFRARDNAVNYSSGPLNAQLDANLSWDASSALSFTYDNSTPVSELKNPVSGTGINGTVAVSTISGTAYTDANKTLTGSAVIQVLVNLWCSGCAAGSNPGWWNGGSWQTGAEPDPPLFAAAVSAPNWSISDTQFPASLWQDGFQYQVYSRAKDVANNIESPEGMGNFIIDFTTPAARVTFPADGGFVSSATTIVLSGTADDRFSALHAGDICNPSCPAGRIYESRLSSVAVAVQDMVTTNYWDGGAFGSGSPVWSTATLVGDSSGTWIYSIAVAGNFNSPRNYKVSAKATDRAGGNGVLLTTNTFTFDTTPAVSLATSPVGSVTAVPAISGTARDDAPGQLSVARLRMQETACSNPLGCHTGWYWNGDAWQSDPIWLSSGIIGSLITGTTYAWSMNTGSVLFDNKSTFTVTAAAVDQAGNVEATHGSVDITFYLQTPAAEATLVQPPSPDMQQYRPTAVAISTITGTGVNIRLSEGVRIQLKRLTEPASYWYDVTQNWSNEASTFVVTNVIDGNPQSFTKFLNSPYTVDNASYSVTVTPIDGAGQPGAPQSRTFVVDTTQPLSALTAPAKTSCAGTDGCFNSMPGISGTSGDPGNPTAQSIVQSGVRVRIKDNASTKYWNGTAFASPSPNPAELTPGNFSPAGNPPTYTWSTNTAVGVALQDGLEYTILAYANDLAGNPSSIPTDAQIPNAAKFVFAYDTSTPTAYFTRPTQSQVYLNLNSVAGTSEDGAGVYGSKKSDMARVEIRIQDPALNVCWSDTNSQFNVTCSSYSVVTNTPTWTYANSNLTGQLASGQPYVLTARGVDIAGNVQNSFGVPASSRTVYVDKGAPQVQVTKPIHPGIYRSSQLSGSSALKGTAADSEEGFYPENDALQLVQLAVSYLFNGTSYYYTGVFGSNGTKFSSNTTESATWFSDVSASTDTWEFFFAAADWISDRAYTVKGRARDKARDAATEAETGNVTNVFTSSTNLMNFIVDDSAPQSGFSNLVSGQFIQDLDVISGTADSDLAGPSTYYLRVYYSTGGNNYYWNGGDWGVANVQHQLPVDPSGTSGPISWSYPGGISGQVQPSIVAQDDTVFTLAIQARDKAANLQSATTIQVTLDRVGPTVVISTPMAAAPNYGTARLLTTLRGTSFDSPAGVSRVETQIVDISDSPNFYWTGYVWSSTVAASYVVTSATNPWTLSAPSWIDNKQYQVTARAVDESGNASPSNPTVAFVYDVNVPSSAISVPSVPFYPLG
ncbi:MAG: hypothetical protein HY551_03970, partial [Elusimicrobia bacterium]|nr:hypothetical protein [Elusimicrobiota bacterium]